MRLLSSSKYSYLLTVGLLVLLLEDLVEVPVLLVVLAHNLLLLSTGRGKAGPVAGRQEVLHPEDDQPLQQAADRIRGRGGWFAKAFPGASQRG